MWFNESSSVALDMEFITKVRIVNILFNSMLVHGPVHVRYITASSEVKKQVKRERRSVSGHRCSISATAGSSACTTHSTCSPVSLTAHKHQYTACQQNRKHMLEYWKSSGLARQSPFWVAVVNPKGWFKTHSDMNLLSDIKHSRQEETLTADSDDEWHYQS